MYKQAKCLIYNINIWGHRTVGYMIVSSKKLPLDWQEKVKMASNIPHSVHKIQKESVQKTQKQVKICQENRPKHQLKHLYHAPIQTNGPTPS